MLEKGHAGQGRKWTEPSTTCCVSVFTQPEPESDLRQPRSIRQSRGTLKALCGRWAPGAKEDPGSCHSAASSLPTAGVGAFDPVPHAQLAPSRIPEVRSHHALDLENPHLDRQTTRTVAWDEPRSEDPVCRRGTDIWPDRITAGFDIAGAGGDLVLHRPDASLCSDCVFCPRIPRGRVGRSVPSLVAA